MGISSYHSSVGESSISSGPLTVQ